MGLAPSPVDPTPSLQPSLLDLPLRPPEFQPDELTGQRQSAGRHIAVNVLRSICVTRLWSWLT